MTPPPTPPDDAIRQLQRLIEEQASAAEEDRLHDGLTMVEISVAFGWGINKTRAWVNRNVDAGSMWMRKGPGRNRGGDRTWKWYYGVVGDG